MHAYVRIVVDASSAVEHELHGPLASVLRCVADHLNGRARGTYDRLAVIDRERAPGNHVFEHAEFVDLVGSAHSLMCDPPAAVRRMRRVLAGPLPAADGIGALLVWLRERSHANEVIYDLWRAATSPSREP